jgi:hypothetical protein
MGAIGAMLADAAGVAARYQARLTADIPVERFGRLAETSGSLVQSNHPAFVLGHLALYPAKVMQVLRLDSTQVMVPEEFLPLFSKDATCQDDPDGTLYPSKERLVEVYQQGYGHVLEAIRHVDDALFLSVNPIEGPLKKVCPTIGAMVGFYLDGHVMMHLGQLSAWRRFEGMAPA